MLLWARGRMSTCTWQELYLLDTTDELQMTVVVNGSAVQGPVLPSDDTFQVAFSVCTHLGGPDFDQQCIQDVFEQVLRRRRPRMMYRIWMDEQHLFAFEVPAGKPTWDAAVATCDDALPRYPNLTLEKCMEMALMEIRDMRYNGIWKTKQPSFPPAHPRTTPYWAAVQAMESAIEQRGHVVYDGHVAHCPEKVRSDLDGASLVASELASARASG
jgi:hypothetical protein